jgi:hypothetical protein
VTGLVWAFAAPVGSSPDDDFHMTSIWCAAGDSEACEVVDEPVGGPPVVRVPALVGNQPCYAQVQEQSAACLYATPPDAMTETNRVNDGLYPPWYYRFMHLLVGDDVNRSILLIRAANLVISTILWGALLFLLAPGGRRLLVYTSLATMVPLTIFIASSVNPSAWAFAGVTTAFFAFNGHLAAARGPRRLALGVLGLVGTLLACAARADAAAYTAVAAAAAVWLQWRSWRPHLQRLVLPAAGFVLGVLGYFGGNQTGALLTGLPEKGEVEPGWLLFDNLQALPGYLGGPWGNGFLGSVGWFDVPVPALTAAAGLAVAAGLAFAGFRRMTWNRAAVLAGLALLIAVLPLVVFQLTGVPVGGYVQPRYIAPLLILFLAVAMMRGPGLRCLRLGRTQTVAFYVAAVLAHAAALHALIRRYTVGTTVPAINLSAAPAWWRAQGPSPMAAWAIGAVAFAVAALALFAVRRADRRPGAAPSGR